MFAPAPVDRFKPGAPPNAVHLADLKWRRNRDKEHLGVIEGVDAMDLRQSGWGVIFGRDCPPSFREALRPLLDLRRQQAGQRFQEFWDDAAPAPLETKREWLTRHSAGGGGPVDPSRVPYYLLIVANPETIPFEFQYQLDVQYAVGRIWFATADEYAAYAGSVVFAETGDLVMPRRAAFFGPANDGDAATELSAEHLVTPLADSVSRDQCDWEVRRSIGDSATRDQLLRLLGGEDTPAFLFTASHGMGFKPGHALQTAHSGALVCQDWPGSGTRGGMRDFYVAAEDIPSGSRLTGTIAMFFACFGAGTPRRDDFAPAKRAELAPQSFVSALPSALLSHPKGGALAVVGHVDRAWECSFRHQGADPQLQTFQSTIKRLLEGQRVGWALEYFNSRYAELSSDLVPVIEEAGEGRQLTRAEIRMIMSQRDARNYAIVGDPAVRLVTGERTPRPERPAEIEIVTRAVEPQASVGHASHPASGVAPASDRPEIAASSDSSLARSEVEAAQAITVTTWHGDRRIAETVVSDTGAETRIDASVTGADSAFLELHQHTLREAVLVVRVRSGRSHP